MQQEMLDRELQEWESAQLLPPMNVEVNVPKQQPPGENPFQLEQNNNGVNPEQKNDEKKVVIYYTSKGGKTHLKPFCQKNQDKK